jgi:hypothetical protein
MNSSAITCHVQCPRELQQHDPVSVGTIVDDESICRGVYPSDKKNGHVKLSFIPPSHLLRGELSVWRVSARAKITIDDLAKILDPMARSSGEKIEEIRICLAKTIREYRLNDETERSFCIVDECDIDDKGGKHPAHAHIKICQTKSRYLEQLDISEPDIEQLRAEIISGMREGLKLIFETIGWSKSSATVSS